MAWSTRVWVMVATAASAVAVPVTISSPASGQTPSPTPTATTLAGTAPVLPGGGSGTLEVMVDVPSAETTDANPAPQTITPTYVTQTTVTSGSQYLVRVPMTLAVAQAASANGGHADFELWLVDGTGTNESTAFTTANINDNSAGADDAPGATQTTDSGSFSSFTPAASQATTQASSSSASQTASAASVTPAATTIFCSWSLDSTTESYTRLGELHVANGTGATGTFEYTTKADSVFTVGMSTDGGSTWSANGTATVSNSIGTSGSVARGQGYVRYIQGHLYYGHYHQTGCAPKLMVRATRAVGDATDGTNTPPTNPYGSCHADPYGLGTEGPHGGWSADTSKAKSYDGVASLWGFSFGGHTGYTSDIKISLYNSSGTAYYFCGTKYLPGVPVVYNNTW